MNVTTMGIISLTELLVQSNGNIILIIINLSDSERPGLDASL